MTLQDLMRGDTFEFADEDHIDGWTIYTFLGIREGWAAYELQMTNRLESGGMSFGSNPHRPVKNVERATEYA